MSLAVTERLINLNKSNTLRESLNIEYRLSQHMVYRDDFNNGVESVLINKDNKPRWNPSKIDEVNDNELNKMFEDCTKKLYL